ncbi:MAG: hypothetical protein P3W94_007000, partial [Paracoccus sp. (in: a-proteobacteria)]|nr:hypothetical protein [Paracoccus sp. (in: a-proteobacteria)]
MPGTGLPPERDLSQRLGISRRAGRRAPEVPQPEGRIWRRQGSGTFAGPSHSDRHEFACRPVTSPANILHIIEARLTPALQRRKGVVHRDGPLQRRQRTPDAGTQHEPAAERFDLAPFCTGPYRFSERVEGDRTVLTTFKDHREANECHDDRLIYQPIPDMTVRLANVRSGNPDIIERMA